MLHPLKVVTCSTEMFALVRFQRGVLQLAIALARGTNMAQVTFESEIGQKSGAAFWKIYTRGEKWASLFNALKDACFKCSPVEQDAMLEAFNHDIDFYNHFENNDWSFHYPDLPADLKKAIQPLFEHCYSYLGDTGYNADISTFTGGNLTRVRFLESYVTANSQIGAICCVCDRSIDTEKNASGTDIPIVDLDHFFPKAIYPFLSLHPYNLIPTCDVCNSKNKGATDTLIDKGNGETVAPVDAFVHTYYSYQKRAILSIDRVLATRSSVPHNELEVTIEDYCKTSLRRIRNANRVYNLHKRWRENFNKKVFEPLILRITHQAKKNKLRDRNDLLNLLQDEREQCYPGQQPNDTLKAAYLDYALKNQRELKILEKAYKGDLVTKIY